MAGTKRRKRRRTKRQKLVRRLISVALASVIVLGVGALGLWLIWDSRPQTTVTTLVVEHEELIRTYAEANGLDPAFVASVIMAESSYREDAVSSVNAQGLMQIMPDTGDWIARKFDEECAEGSLFDPDTNIRYGCWYLGYLINRFGGDMRCAAAAYHQGQGRVDKWLSNPDYSADGKTLVKIPSAATEKYVNRILKYYEEYEKIYHS